MNTETITSPIEQGDKGTAVKVRNSNLELFRIITMILIVAHHYISSSGLAYDDGLIYANPTSWRSLFLLLFGAWGKTGINCFVLITGYFMCKSHITPKKFIKLLGEIMFYKIVIGLIFLVSGYPLFTIKSFVKMMLPIYSIGTGFVSAYLVFFLCIPFLNLLINSMSEKMHIRLLLLLSFTYIFLETVPYFEVKMNYVSWFAVLYLIASYVRIYPKKIFSNTKLYGWLTLALLLISSLSVVACAHIPAICATGKKAYYFVSDSNTLLAALTGFSAFMYFKNIKIKNSKFINTIAASTFGVLMIHANSSVMTEWLWKDFLKNVSMYYSEWLVLHAIGSVIGIYVICTLIDLLRIQFIEKPFFKLWDKHWDKIADKYIKIESKICKKVNIKETKE